MNEKLKAFFKTYKTRIIIGCVVLLVYAGSCAGFFLYGRNRRISALESNTAVELVEQSAARCEELESELSDRISELDIVNRSLDSVGSSIDDCIGIVRQLDQSNRSIVESSGNIEATSTIIAKLARELSARVDNYEAGLTKLSEQLEECKAGISKQ